ncbi:PREDICTED: glycosyltransferase-like protein gnt13 [Camelina sativa]|uniref:Glycosyltransferase-like protein gnt13 n=1 Tax=Camelina sativa TaxID=90675 RepID=A0ABM0XDY9_CAMSA|nr:PREDICTED: glycosyltransferase-like protein gnt13 [Camelina sativa]XP_010484506.1 PREDICTED: glycosyltransferase-like protein gnt13 [Camelina sativa]
MEKLLNPYDKQCMKMAMLKHEETFKQQVYELHRLYQVQKILMKNMEINKLSTKGNNNVNSGLGTFIRRVDHEIDRPANFPGGNNNNNIEIMDESEIELTLGPSCYGDGDLMRMSKKKKKNSSPEMMMDGNLNSGRRSFSSSSTGSSNNNNNNNNLEEQVRIMKHQKQKQPWLQALTLNVI